MFAGSIECRADHFSCGAARPCIPWSWRCDGHVDCTNGHDESSETCNVDFLLSLLLFLAVLHSDVFHHVKAEEKHDKYLVLLMQ